jgi:flagellar biosynthesis/type III secretory pathway M-ring protein FliF/YscJ
MNPKALALILVAVVVVVAIVVWVVVWWLGRQATDVRTIIRNLNADRLDLNR